MIRFIIETISSKRDVNGNRYHVATITSTATRNELLLHGLGGKSSAGWLVRNALKLEWDEVYDTRSELPIREFRRLFHHKMGKYEHEVTPAMIGELEVQS